MQHYAGLLPDGNGNGNAVDLMASVPWGIRCTSLWRLRAAVMIGTLSIRVYYQCVKLRVAESHLWLDGK